MDTYSLLPKLLSEYLMKRRMSTDGGLMLEISSEVDLIWTGQVRKHGEKTNLIFVLSFKALGIGKEF